VGIESSPAATGLEQAVMVDHKAVKTLAKQAGLESPVGAALINLLENYQEVKLQLESVERELSLIRAAFQSLMRQS
jgi:hypothetical protein